MTNTDRIKQLIPQLAGNPTRRDCGDNDTDRRLADLNWWLETDGGFAAPSGHIQSQFSSIYTVEGKEIAVVVVDKVLYVFEGGGFIGSIDSASDLYHDLERAIAPNSYITLDSGERKG